MSEHRSLAGDHALAEIADAIGEDGARKLARALGGTQMYVPRTLGEHHPLRSVLGEHLAVKLTTNFGGERLNIPKGPERRERVKVLRRTRSLTITAIALDTGYSERHVYRLLSDTGERHPDLFDEIDIT